MELGWLLLNYSPLAGHGWSLPQGPWTKLEALAASLPTRGRCCA